MNLRKVLRHFFGMPKILPPLTKLLPEPEKLHRRSYRQYEGNKKLPDCLRKATRLCEALVILSCSHRIIVRWHPTRKWTFARFFGNFLVCQRFCHRSRSCCRSLRNSTGGHTMALDAPPNKDIKQKYTKE
jgi:hypothetical protein